MTGLFFTGETPFIGDALFTLDRDLAGAALVGLGLTRDVSGRPERANLTGDPGFDESFATKVLNPSVKPAAFS